ncbi:Ran GAP Rna1 [Yamadazyma tenuis]|uniref:RNI-like protein n=1 Tax=Candida tenuis (strain ATCC 10573 / BCRC 21748 / CBS 615 / JCM 9827 / NBRC 10315 / NRRL Y-1498 / VKM Y-70) TaxID=590646 RepID=G3B4Z8_CANTC|nr:RNI-like protein [Yamadazyma tenuis ATCC 10573]XP_006686646.1 uncharacterized protein CANTEDRAFT_114061 [Yamadazyma tenuis ATCC 10573]EGV64331.1 RNI-like protein [Yamadazyma tenuis ATCC 10573]EGV64332.1 hypothetical protein CANTEDRAFT_114061 [Yamadazyma tenuis ATCC 10573]WEJ96354.1 Ran GAP Rna1 [Yamadazyma tenuis]
MSDIEYSIAGKQLKLNSAEDVEFIAKDLSDKSDIEKIDLSGNTIGIESSERISEILTKFQHSLKEINLSDIFTGRLNTEVPKCLDHLLPTLLKFPKLTTINLSDNALGLQTIEPIENYLAKAYTLEHLILSNNGMGPFSGERIGKALYKLSTLKKQKKYPSLKTFICGRNRLENGSMKYLALGLINHKDLQEVRLYQNGIRPIGIATLLSGLKQNQKLKVLDLQDNTLTSLGSSAIASNLGSWTALEELNLNDCLTKSKGFLHILTNLPLVKDLKVLKLQYNELDKTALTKLYELIDSGKVTVQKLEINGNKLEEDDELIEKFVELFEDKEIDDLDEMEGEDSDEEDEDDEEDDEEVEIIDFVALGKELDGTDEDKDEAVDDVAEELQKTHIN